jgi:subtilisin family serine protease
MPICYRSVYCDAGSPSTFGQASGTSAATANVAGVVGLVRAVHPTETPAQIWERIVATAEGPNRVVNALAAINWQRPLAASISGPTTAPIYSYQNWTASAANGTAPYNYTWLRNGAAVHTGQTYNGYVDGSFTLQVQVSDATGRTANASMYVTAS